MTPMHDDRTAVADVLDRDEAYDRDPRGDPPLWVAGYRRALRAAMAVMPAPHPGVPEPWAGGGAEAYLAGRRDALDTVARGVARALGVGDAG
jgi:hypothetical protein